MRPTHADRGARLRRHMTTSPTAAADALREWDWEGLGALIEEYGANVSPSSRRSSWLISAHPLRGARLPLALEPRGDRARGRAVQLVDRADRDQYHTSASSSRASGRRRSPARRWARADKIIRDIELALRREVAPPEGWGHRALVPRARRRCSPSPHSGRRYVEASLVYPDGDIHEVKVKFRGDHFWHFANRKKSMHQGEEEAPLRTHARGEPERAQDAGPGVRAHLLVLARQLGLIAPKSEMVELFVNGENCGVHLLFEQMEEMTRGPGEDAGDLYRDVVSVTIPVWDQLFENAGLWEKIAINNHFDLHEYAAMERLVDLLAEPASAARSAAARSSTSRSSAAMRPSASSARLSTTTRRTTGASTTTPGGRASSPRSGTRWMAHGWAPRPGRPSARDAHGADRPRADRGRRVPGRPAARPRRVLRRGQGRGTPGGRRRDHREFAGGHRSGPGALHDLEG